MDYPASIRIEKPESIARWRPLVQWFLAIPQIVVLAILGGVRNNLALLSWLIIVFRGRLPEGIATVQAATLRYGLRVNGYASFLTDTYPRCSFELSNADPGGSAVVADFAPEAAGRRRASVFFRLLLAIPAIIFSVLIGVVANLAQLFGLIAVLVLGRWPDLLWNWVMKGLVVGNRLNAYTLLLTDRYPPFSTR